MDIMQDTHELLKRVDKALNLNSQMALHDRDGEGDTYITFAGDDETWFEVTVEPMNKKKHREFGRRQVLNVTRFREYPGVRYYPDGSGEPPSVEEVESASFLSSVGVVTWIMSKCIRSIVLDELDGMYEEKLSEMSLAEFGGPF